MEPDNMDVDNNDIDVDNNDEVFLQANESENEDEASQNPNVNGVDLLADLRPVLPQNPQEAIQRDDILAAVGEDQGFPIGADIRAIEKTDRYYQNLGLAFTQNPYFRLEYLPMLIQALRFKRYVMTDDMNEVMNMITPPPGDEVRHLLRQYEIVAHVNYIDMVVENRRPIARFARIVKITREQDGALGLYNIVVRLKKVVPLPDELQILVFRSKQLEGKEPFKVYNGVVSEQLIGRNNNERIITLSHADEHNDGLKLGMQLDIFVKPFTLPFDTCMTVLAIAQDNHEVARKLFHPHPERAFSLDSHDVYQITGTPAQNAAADMIGNMKGEIAKVVFGPPGTGKTYTLAETIMKILEEQKTSKILILTPTNQAADKIALSLREKGISREIILRLMSSSIRAASRPPALNDISFFHGDWYATPNAKQISPFRVIVSTIGRSWILYRYLPQGSLDYIIVDEAGQAPEFDIITPLMFFCSKETKIVLTGDPKQLGPIVSSNLLNRACYDTVQNSTLRRLSNHPAYINNQNLMITLNTNFRSHPMIAQIPSDVFYNGVYRATHNAAHLCMEGSPVLYGSEKTPIRYISVEGQEERSDYGSYFNVNEIQKVEELIDRIFQHHPNDITQADIGIITPYRAQVIRLRDLLSRKYPGILINSVYKFQGDERRVIIFSTVRRQKFGFLQDPRQLTTAITRAMHMLIILGDRHLWKTDINWKAYISRLCDYGLCYYEDGIQWENEPPAIVAPQDPVDEASPEE